MTRRPMFAGTAGSAVPAWGSNHGLVRPGDEDFAPGCACGWRPRRRHPAWFLPGRSEEAELRDVAQHVREARRTEARETLRALGQAVSLAYSFLEGDDRSQAPGIGGNSGRGVREVDTPSGVQSTVCVSEARLMARGRGRHRAEVPPIEAPVAIGYAIAAVSSNGYVWPATIPGATTFHQSLDVVRDALTASTAENYHLCALIPVEGA